MKNSLKKKTLQLGLNISTASNQLRKSVLFYYVKLAGDNVCYQCGSEIKNIDDFSIEHKVPWLDSDCPECLFFDLDNIAFSHLNCNTKAARQTRILKHPSIESYRRGCRCVDCKEIQKLRMRKLRIKSKTNS